VIPVLLGFTVNVNTNSLDPVEAAHSPGLGSSGVAGASASGSSAVGAGAVPPAHPAKIMLTTVTTVNIGMTDFFIFASFLHPSLYWGVGDEERSKISS
jgi:hypothetical protein